MASNLTLSDNNIGSRTGILQHLRCFSVIRELTYDVRAEERHFLFTIITWQPKLATVLFL